MSRKSSKAPLIIYAEPKRSSAPNNYNAPAPPRLPESKSHTRSSLNGPQHYEFAEEVPYDAYRDDEYLYAMSQSSSLSPPGSSSGWSNTSSQETVRGIMRVPITTGGRESGGPTQNPHGYEYTIRGDTVVHNHGAAYFDPLRNPARQSQARIPYRSFPDRRPGYYNQ